MIYQLMHKDEVCGELTEISGVIQSYQDNGEGFSPFLGNCDFDKIKKWWTMRSVPASRHAMQEMLRNAGYENPGSYLAKNLAVSISDTYWIRPLRENLTYQDVKFYNLADYTGGKVPYHNATSYDPNASLGGQMEKYWDLTGDIPILVKECSQYFGQQSVNEVFATHIHDLQKTDIPYVRYHGSITEHGSVLSKCEAFTSDKAELISAYEIIESEKKPNGQSYFDMYIDVCVRAGIDCQAMQDFMDYMILTDFIISNTDEHLQNFGVLRDPDTMKIIGPAPIYDSGNSMFYNENRKIPYTRSDILDREITSFYSREEKLLKKVVNRNIVKEDLLPSPTEVKELYAESGIPEWKAVVIAENYNTKLQLFHEFKKGKTISAYKEKMQQRKSERIIGRGKFILMCGIPGSGKTEKAERLCIDAAKTIKSAIPLYTIEAALRDNHFLQNKGTVLESMTPVAGYNNTVVNISVNEIRNELKSTGNQIYDDLVFLIADARIVRALRSGADVVYDAANLDRDIRIHYQELAADAGAGEKILCLMEVAPEESAAEIPSERLKYLADRLKASDPYEESGWDQIIISEKNMK